MRGGANVGDLSRSWRRLLSTAGYSSFAFILKRRMKCDGELWFSTAAKFVYDDDEGRVERSDDQGWSPSPTCIPVQEAGRATLA
jgi:hypothetical protein